MTPSYNYLFIWDKVEQRVQASFYIVRRDGYGDRPGDTSHGAIPQERELEAIETLRRRFPRDRYLFAGGFAPSLEDCVRGFFGMERDTDVYGSG